MDDTEYVFNLNTSGPAEPAEIPPPPEKSPVWGPWATFGLAIVIIIVPAIILGIIGGVLAIVLVSSGTIDIGNADDITVYIEEYLGVIVTISTIANGIIGTALIALFIKARKGIGFSEYLGFRRFSGKSLVFSLLALVGLLVFSYIIETITGGSGEEAVNYFNTSIWPGLVWFAVCIVAPFFEEIWIRGFMYRGFINSRLGLTGTLLVTSAFWAVQHIQYDFAGIGIIFVFGLILGFVRHKSGSIWLPIIMHAINNTISMALMMMA